ncbi:hypothetical protein COEREDRAFT_16749 [Coemansia reversa NRRL 1564]|uniref:Uncharacterized protein n=1 Tax=Coemansia reversa (strain ATCC 12441 / NRRL 1564) TaxID=763665 RepID=A0A2G5B6I0_COERN|nr:hypothetical protein COEREDRAFT_16749 [Coemansia reversa NRRL 1564]|eukprot:PIA14611.1 hypothetical protein COEREDRAFT_16749 [Coemansia reversa NRRL 1564]
MSELHMFVAGARFAGIVLSSISAFASLIVIISYTRTVMKSRAHHRRIIEASNIPAGANAAAGGGALADTCFSCESFLETPCSNQHCFSSHNLQAQYSRKSSSRAATSHPHQGSIALAGVASTTPCGASLYSYTPSTEKCCDSCRRDDHISDYRQGTLSKTICAKGAGGVLGAPTHHILQSQLCTNTVTHPLLRLSTGQSAAPPAKPVPAATVAALDGEYPASESAWSLSSIYKKPRSFRRIHLPCPIEYYNRMAANMSLERLAGVGGNQKRRLPRIPSSKIAVLSGVDFLMHIMWIINTSAARSSAGCTVTLFLFQWVQLFYMFYLASFAFSSLMRLRNMQAIRPQHQKRTDTIVAISIGAAAFLLSLLPAIMTNAAYNEDLHTCWFAHDSIESLRWVWMSLNAWVVLSLLFLGAASIYIGVILSNERRNLLRSIARPVSMTAMPTTTFTNEPKMSVRGLPQSLNIPPAGTTSSQPAATSPLRYQLSMSRYPSQMVITPTHSMGARAGNVSGSGSNSRNSYRYNSAAFGTKTTMLASRDFPGVQQSSAYYGKRSRTRSNSNNSPQSHIVSATNPVALAHEALHGRRNGAMTAVSPLKARHISSQDGNRAACCEPQTQRQQQTGDIFASASRKSASSSGDYGNACGKHVWHMRRASSTSLSKRNSRIVSDGHSRHLCDISEGNMTLGGNVKGYHPNLNGVCRRRSQPACSSEQSGMYAEYTHVAPRTSRSDSVAPQFLKSTSNTAGGQQQQKSRRMSYGSLARSAEFNGIWGTCNQSQPTMTYKQVRRSDKHMSLPVNAGDHVIGTGGYTNSYIAPRHVRQHSLPFRAPPDTSGGFSTNGADKRYPHYVCNSRDATAVGLSSSCSLGPDSSNPPRQPQIYHDKEKAANIYLGPSESEQEYGSGKFLKALYACTDLILCSISKLRRRSAKSLSECKKGRGRAAAGQIRRIEQRVHVLIATGALRVATRAMVPLITQLTMVVWSTLYSLGLLYTSHGSLYMTAILMLSTQGLLGMMLYYIFDTQSDASTISLPNYTSHSKGNNNTPATVPTGNHYAFLSGMGGKRVSPPSGGAPAHQLQNRPHNDVYYVPRASYERKKPLSQYKSCCNSTGQYCYHTQQQQSRQQTESIHNQYRHYYNEMRMSLDQDNSLLVTQHRWGPKAYASTYRHSDSIASARSSDHIPVSNIEGLNVRLANRTSNAMRSDTLNGSECVAWSHLDTQSNFDDGSVSRCSTSMPLTQHHRPVLNGWEENDMEETDSLQPPHSN